MKRLFFVLVCSLVILLSKALSSNEMCLSRCASTTKQYINSTITLKILLVEFTDVKHRTSPSAYTKTDFENLLVSNGVYVSPNMHSPDNENVYGSLRDYYQKMSNGNLTITGFVVNNVQNNIPIWITLPNTKTYYDNRNYDTLIAHVKSAATTKGLNIGGLGDYVKLAIIYAGNIYYNSILNPSTDNLGTLYIMSERNGSPIRPSGEHSTDVFSRIGVHCHEFAHLIGIGHSQGSRADIMEAGRRNGPDNGGSNGAAPAPLNPVARMLKGWLTPIPITGDVTCNAIYSLTAPQVYKITSNTNGDYFLIENRRFNQNMSIGSTTVLDYNNSAFMPISWSSNSTNVIYSQGILIWRYIGGNTYYDYANNGLVYASGRYGASYPDNIPSETDAGDLFPGTAGVKIFSPWSDSRDPYTSERDPFNPDNTHYTLYVPNTRGGTNVGMEVLSENTSGGYFTLRLHSAQQVLSSTISSSQTLSGEYICTGNVTINSGVTVNINAGSTLVFQSGISLNNYGVLKVNGTSSQSVTFTSQTGNS
jgi:M6 family metalloprotease-like protein